MRMQHRPMKVFKDGGEVSCSVEDRVSVFAQRDTQVCPWFTVIILLHAER